MSNIEQLKRYIPLVEFIAQVLGEDCEVVLHDTSNLDHSILAIANGHVSGRKLNGPITDLALKILMDKAYKNNNFLCNYKGSYKSNKTFRSSSYFIKNDDGDLIGMLCVNVDISKFIETRNLLDKFIGVNLNDNLKEHNSNSISIFENLEENIDDLIHSIISSVLSEYDISPERMSVDEKMDVVRKLNDKGIFLLKGGVSEVAKKLKASEATIYRYLSKIK